MIKLSISPGETGIRFQIQTKRNLSFKLSYTAICEGGRIIYGNINGNALKNAQEDWRHITIPYPVIFVGVTRLETGTNSRLLSDQSANVLKTSRSHLDFDRYTQYLEEYDLYLQAPKQFDPYGMHIDGRFDFMSNLEDFVPIPKDTYRYDPYLNDQYLLGRYEFNPYLGPIGSNNF